MILVLPIGVMFFYSPILTIVSYFICGLSTVMVLSRNKIFSKVISIQEHTLNQELGFSQSFLISVWAGIVVLFTWISLDVKRVIREINNEYDTRFGDKD